MSSRGRLLTGLAALAALASAQCSSGGASEHAAARVVTSRADLIGGDRALGDVGDYLLENGQIRIVVQGPSYSRGFGVYGGSLLDADLRRPSDEGSSAGGVGYDAFGELFPAFFLQATAVDTVSVLNDGSNGAPAQVEASGYAGDFLEIAGVLNRAITGSNSFFLSSTSDPTLRYSTIYEIAPGARWVKLTFSVQNIGTADLAFPNPISDDLLNNQLHLTTQGFTVPLGDVALFGATSDVFIPGVGFDVRFGLQDAYAKNIQWPAFPGLIAEFVASRSANVSYGMVVEESEHNYVYNKASIYDDGTSPITKSSLLVPFVASSFLGVFHEEAPPTLAAGDTFQVVKYFVLGNGDIGSVLDGIYALRGTQTGHFGGQVYDIPTGSPQSGLSVMVYQRTATTHRPFSQYQTYADGSFGGDLEPGAYSLRVTGSGRKESDYVDFDVSAGATTAVRVGANGFGRVVVNVLDSNGQPLPAKASAVASYSPADAGKAGRTFLFDLAAGEDFRVTDMVPDDPSDASTLRYVEAVGATTNGQVELHVRPGTYEIRSSRGPEWDTASTTITVDAGRTVNVGHELHHVVDTSGWIAADFHLHSIHSIDSPFALDDRVRYAAAEGVEWGVSTDHNYVTDLAPIVERNGLTQWLKTTVGLELTTLESGHFNGYPLDYQVNLTTHGSFNWVDQTPDQLFSGLRAIGDASTIVQCNHPRDSILGYFGQYDRDGLTMAYDEPSGLSGILSPKGPAFLDEAGHTTFSLDFDTMELTNGKLYWELHHYRVPSVLPMGTLPTTIPPAGTILTSATTGEVAFPGAIDDWYNLLNTGHHPIGVGVSDSHEPLDETGYFRTMVYVGDDTVTTLTDATLTAALRAGRAVATNGPLIDFYVDDPTRGVIGQTIGSTSDHVTLTGRVTAAPWIKLDHLNIVRNGVIASRLAIDSTRDLAASPFTFSIAVPLAVDATGAPIDSWYVVEAIGNTSYFPMVRPLELPPLNLTDAIGSIAGPLGLGSSEFGALQPSKVFPIVGFAITNPVWVTTSDQPFRAPGLVAPAVQIDPSNDPGLPVTAPGNITPDPTEIRPNPRIFDPRPGNPIDIRNILQRAVDTR